MKTLRSATALAFVFFSVHLAAQDVAVKVVQDFEGNVELNKWPSNRPGDVAFSTEWQKDGKRSVKIDPGLMYCVSQFKTKNWSGFSVLRMHLKNPGDKAVNVGFELQDRHKSFRYRHQGSFGIVPGENVIEMDIAGGLWRGEENAPYKGLKEKKPIDMSLITRIGFINKGKVPIFLDRIEVVKKKKIEAQGAFAFDFGRAKTQVAPQMLGVFNDTSYNAKRGYGLVGGRPSMLGKSMSFPTPMLGDGLGFNAGGFKVDLPGGPYVGMIAFERGGFWSDEDSTYTRAVLKNNGTLVHEHAYTRDGKAFMLQDAEAVNADEIIKKVIFPSHAISRFKMTAAKGTNHFTLETEKLSGYPLRVAGLLLAPDTDEGRAFLTAHDKLMHKTILQTFALENRGQRKGRKQPAKPLVVETLPIGAQVYPTDWPSKPAGGLPEASLAVSGQTVAIQLGVYAQSEGAASVEASALTGPGKINGASVSHGRYLPMRPYGTGSMWLPVNHYRPEANFSIGPKLTRSVLVEYKIPKEAKAGTYKGSVKISGLKQTITVPVEVKVMQAKLENIPIPVGLYCNALPVRKDRVDEKTWWRLQESLLVEQLGAGLNVLSGQTGLGLKLKKEGGKASFVNPDAIRYIKLAQKIGYVRAIVGYGGFLPRRPILSASKATQKEYGDAIKRLEKENNFPPFYLNAYDEPMVQHTAGIAKQVGGATEGGVRTVGWTSWHGKSKDWLGLVKSSHASAMNGHTGENLREIAKLGTEPWVYNNGLGRLGMGLRIWRSMQFGAKGRMQWIGLITQGIAFNDLDGREPEPGCFRVHRTLGMLKTPAWLGVREGLLDLRIRLTLEKLAPKDDPALKVWTVDGYRKDEAQWTNAKLEAARRTMLKRLVSLTGK